MFPFHHKGSEHQTNSGHQARWQAPLPIFWPLPLTYLRWSHTVAQADLKLMELEGSIVMTPKFCPVCCPLKQSIHSFTLWLWVYFPLRWYHTKGYTISMHLKRWDCPPCTQYWETPLPSIPQWSLEKKNIAELPKSPCPLSGKKATKNLPTPRKSFKLRSSLDLPMITIQKGGGVDLWIKPFMKTTVQVLRNHT